MSVLVAPDSLRATVLSATEVLVRWQDRSANETGFRLERKAGAGAYALLASLSANSVEYSDTGLAAETTYTYRVRAENAAGSSAWADEATATPYSLGYYSASFSGADGTELADYVPETGEQVPLAIPIGDFEIQSNRLAATNVDYGLCLSLWEGVADHSGSVICHYAGLTSGVVVRGTDAANHWWIRISDNLFALYRRVDGTDTAVTTAAPTIAAGNAYTVAWTCQGKQITATLDSGNTLTSLAATFNQAARLFGVRTGFEGNAWDTLTVAPTGAAAVDAVTIDNPAAFQLFQADANDQTDIAISGSYTGTPTAIEVRWTPPTTGPAGPWVTVDQRPLAGQFSGILPLQNAGQGTLQTRFANRSFVIGSRAGVGVGLNCLLIGQSNIVGVLTAYQSFSHASLKSYVYRQDLLHRLTNDPGVHTFQTTTGSPWPHLATLLMAALGVPVNFFSCGVGGTGLVTPGEWAVGGEQYLNTVRQVLASGVPKIDIILWHQGETDAVMGSNGAAYQAAEAALLAGLRADVPALAEAVMFSAMLGQYASGPTRSQLDAIRLAKLANWIAGNGIYPGPNIVDLNLAAAGDNVHVTSTAHGLLLSQRWARSILYVLTGAGDGRGPRFASAAKTGATTVAVTWTGGSGALQNGTVAAGYRVTDANGVRALQSPCSIAGSVVTLTVDQALVDPVLVSFGSFNDAAFDTTIRDSGTYYLPPEPFVDQVAA